MPQQPEGFVPDGFEPDAPAGAPDAAPAPPLGSATGRFVGGVAHQLNPITMAEGLYKAVRHPYDTAVAAVGQMGDQWTQAGQEFDRAQHAQGLDKPTSYLAAGGHALAGSIPFLGPAAAQIGTQAGTGDLAGAAGEATGLLALSSPSALRAGMRVPGQVARATGAAEPIARAAETASTSRMVDVMAPKVGQNKTRFGNNAAAVAQDVASEPGMSAFSRGGLRSKVAGKLEEFSGKLDEAADARNAGKAFDTDPILEGLYAARRKLTAEAVEGSQTARRTSTRTSPIVDEAGKPITVSESHAVPIGEDVIPRHNAARVAQIDSAIAEIKTLGKQARYEALRRIRQSYDGPAKAVYNPSLTADFLTAQGSKFGAADVTGVLRDHLAKFDPHTAAVNQKWALWKKADDVMQAAEEVDRVRPQVGRQIIARGFGTLLGERAGGTLGAGMGYVLGPMVDDILRQAPTMKVITARALTELADALRKGDTPTAITKMKLLQSLALRVGTRAAAEQESH